MPTYSVRPLARPTGPSWDATVERQRRASGARTVRSPSPRNVTLPNPRSPYLPMDDRRLRPQPQTRPVAPAVSPEPKAIPDPLAALDIAKFLRRLASPLALVATPTMLADGGYYPTPFAVQSTAPEAPPDPFPSDYDVTRPDYEPAVDLQTVPDLGTEITLDMLPELDVASAIAGRKVVSSTTAREIIASAPPQVLGRLDLEISVQITVENTPNGPMLRGRTRARNTRNPQKKKDRKVRSANMGSRMLRGALDMFGKASEVVDAYEAVIWAVYVQDANGNIVPALTRMSHREVLQALALRDPTVRFDVIGAVENYVLMQLSDYAVGKTMQRLDQNALAFGWNKDLGLASLSAVGNRSARLDAYSSEVEEGSYQLKEHENAQLSISRSLIPLLREASGSEAFREARVSHLFQST